MKEITRENDSDRYDLVFKISGGFKLLRDNRFDEVSIRLITIL